MDYKDDIITNLTFNVVDYKTQLEVLKEMFVFEMKDNEQKKEEFGTKFIKRYMELKPIYANQYGKDLEKGSFAALSINPMPTPLRESLFVRS